MTVGGNSSLEDGFRQMFCDIEMLTGKNQYRCEICRKLVDAKKVNNVKTSSKQFEVTFFFSRLEFVIKSLKVIQIVGFLGVGWWVEFFGKLTGISEIDTNILKYGLVHKMIDFVCRVIVSVGVSKQSMSAPW